jgi:hypothetical protein
MDAVIWTAMAVVAVCWYPVSCAFHPYRDCGVCSGTGSHRRHDDRSLSRPCWWCKGAGKRLRWGRRLWNRRRR